MLITKRTAGLVKRGSKFVRKNVLSTTEPQTYNWRLTNDQVTFDFISDEITGVKLASFSTKEGTKTWTNKSRTLWILNTVRYINKASDELIKFPFRADIYPTKETFVAPSLVPIVSSGVKSFSFEWANVRYNKKYPDLTCNVTLTASLSETSSSLELSLSVSSNQIINPTSVPGINDVIIQAVHYPKFIFKESGIEEDDNNLVFGIPVGLGQSVTRPAYYLSSPRYLTETFHFDADYHRVLFNGGPVGNSPLVNLYKANHGHPGYVSVPCFVYGDKAAKEGFLLYARDPDGLHAKGFQWFSDDKSLHFRAYDVSDYEVDAYGMGGKKVEEVDSDVSYTTYGNATNTLGWKLCIRPFVANTRWVDWYGFKLYKEEVQPLDVEAGRIAPSFYDRALAGDLDLRAAECPVVLNSLSFITEDGSELLDAAAFWQSELKNATTPPKEYDPQFPCHIQSVTLGAGPKTGTNSGDYGSHYWGWESWTNGPLSYNYGPSGYKSPDFLPINDLHVRLFSGLGALGVHPYSYMVHPFLITSGSEWTIANSGMDLVIHTYEFSDHVVQPEEWHNYAISNDVTLAGTQPQGNNDVYLACFAVEENYNKFVSIASGLVDNGAGLYHDTCGLWGRGCYAHSHKYIKSGNQVTSTHPRGMFSHYHNYHQKRWLTTLTDKIANSANQNFAGSGISKFALARAAEYPCDTNLPDVPVALWYGAQEAPYYWYFKDVYNHFRRDTLHRAMSAVVGVYDVAIQPPAWSQRCPAYTIIYGDRSAINHWSFPNLSNFFSLPETIPGFRPSGYDPVTQETVYYPLDFEHKRMEAASWLANHIGSIKRLSLSHQPRDYWEILRQANSGINLDHHDVFYNTQASGILNYARGYIRMASYEPDYIWHGTTEHPLDDWTVEASTEISYSLNAYAHSRYPTTEGPNYSGLGLDKIVHNVYRKRNSSSILIGLTNWYSGSETFSSSFDPLTYNIEGSYEIYKLDLTPENHGTKSLVAIKNENQVHDFSITLPAYSWEAYEIVPITDVSTSSLYSDLAVSYINASYSYGATELTTACLSTPYSYGTSVYSLPDDPMVGYKAAMTQQITNNLPQWMAIRQKNTSNGWRLVNSWGMNLEDVVTNTAYNLSDVWLVTSDTKQRSKVYAADISEKELVEPKEKLNLLFNSSFTIKDSSIYGGPAGWNTYQKGSASLSNSSIITPKSVILSPATSITQTLEGDDQLYPSLVASAYIKANANDTSVKIVVSLETTDGPTLSYSASITSRSEEWRRLNRTISSLNTRIRRIKFTIVNESDDIVSVSAPMLHTGTMLSNWTNSDKDGLPYLNSTTRFSTVQAISPDYLKRIPIFGISSESEFIRTQIPTRIEKTKLSNQELGSFTQQQAGRKVDFFMQVYDVMWEVKNNKIIERSNGPSQFDYFGEYSVRDLRFYYENIYSTRPDSLVSRELVTASVRSNLLLCVVKETYKGVTKYILKVVVPKTPPGSQDYLESIVDFDLNLEDQIITSIEISDTETNIIQLTTSQGSKIHYKLYFDYYYFNDSNNQLYTLETYNGYKIQVL